jgi:phosphoserine phosphatase RsbU/P
MSSVEADLLAELQTRRERLAELADRQSEERLVELLRRVDAALVRAEQGDWGLCVTCKSEIETELLDRDPLVKICLECLSAPERKALERDLEQAATVQRALLPPRRLQESGWEAAWLWEPKGAVSGDYLDLLQPRAPGDPLHVLLGDVAGKGVAASLLQSHLHALFRALFAPCPAIGELLALANRQFFAATTASSYATLVALRLFPNGAAELSSAGHPRPLLADRRGVRPVEGSGLPLGLFREAAYTDHSLKLEAGDTLLLYSDGWTEAASGDDEFGIGRASAALRRASRLPLPELLAACRQEMQEFLAGAERSDDLTLLALRRAG